MKAEALLGQLLELQAQGHFAGGGGVGIEHMDVLFRVRGHGHLGAGIGAIICAAHLGGKGDDINILFGALAGLGKGHGGRTGGAGRGAAFCHIRQEGGAIQGCVIDEGAAVQVDGKGYPRNKGENVLSLLHIIAAAVCNDLIMHGLVVLFMDYRLVPRKKSAKVPGPLWAPITGPT